MLFNLYKKFVINYPTMVLFVLPSIIFLYSSSLPFDIKTYNIAFGTCEFARFTFDLSNKFLYNVLGLVLIVSSIFIQFNFLRKNPIKKRLLVYKKWRCAAYLGILSLVPVSVGIACNIKQINPFELEEWSIVTLLSAYLLMIGLSEYTARKRRDNLNKYKSS